MKQLIITADDYGLNSQYDRGVMEALEKGILTDVSIFACGPNYSQAIKHLKKKSFKRVGIHLTLTTHKPVCDKNQVPSLLNTSGHFYQNYLIFFIKFLVGNIKKEEIKKELKAQINKLREDGFDICHANGHEHIHMLPLFNKLIAEILREEKIPYVRIPLEQYNYRHFKFNFKSYLRYQLLRLISLINANSYQPILSNEHYFGHFHSGDLNQVNFESIIHSLKAGVTEINVHPGYVSNELLQAFPWYHNAEVELEVLLNPNNKSFLKSKEIELISYGDIVNL